MEESFQSYRLRQTPIYCATHYCPMGNLFLKLEQYNSSGSIKERTAYYIMKDLLERKVLGSNSKLVESSSGNLGLALGQFARNLGISFLCLIDPTLPPAKVTELEENEIQTHVVSLDKYATYRDARINLASKLDQEADWIWTRQYANPANVRAHYEVTGPEIWSQMRYEVDYLVASVGTGGTICGIGRFLKEQNPLTQVIAVEPRGSTIFGGQISDYLSVGSGMNGPSEIIKQYGDIIDYHTHVTDEDALVACCELQQVEGLSVGISSGAALVVGQYLACIHPDSCVVVISPDGGERYTEFFRTISSDYHRAFDPADLSKYVSEPIFA